MADYSTGLELVLNACEGVLQIAVTDDEKPLCFEEWHQNRRATEILACALEEICRRLGTRMTAFRRIGCFSGPGSFTGIRLVLATAAAIRRAGHAQLASLDYLQALATSAVIRGNLLYPGKVFVLTHARRGLVHFQEFSSFGPQIPAQPACPVALLSPEDALGRIAAADSCLVCGSGIGRNQRQFQLTRTGLGPAGAPEAELMPGLTNPDQEALCLLARHGDYFPRDIEPRYVRPCDAVENLDSPAAGAGAARAVEDILGREPRSAT